MSLRDLEAESIRAFVVSCSDYLTGDVLDFGCGTQPYRETVERAGGTYHPYDRVELSANKSGQDVGWDADHPRLLRYDAVVCTQVIQYIPDVPALFRDLHQLLQPAGYLVMTGPTNWPVVEQGDLHRHTLTGVRELLTGAGFRFLKITDRASIRFEGEQWSLGWGALARAAQ